MPTLHLVRHAKSNRDAPALDDHDRPLAPRGRKAAPAMARWMDENGIAPDLVLVSTARRCRETLSAMLPELSVHPRVEAEAGLYLAAADELLARLRRISDDSREAMVLAHNPGLHELALMLAAPGDGTVRESLAEKFPTAALCSFAVPRTWQAIKPGSCRLIRFIRPSDITGSS